MQQITQHNQCRQGKPKDETPTFLLLSPTTSVHQCPLQESLRSRFYKEIPAPQPTSVSPHNIFDWCPENWQHQLRSSFVHSSSIFYCVFLKPMEGQIKQMISGGSNTAEFCSASKQDDSFSKQLGKSQGMLLA